MPSPKIIKQEGAYVLVETDFKLANLMSTKAYKGVYGDFPIIFKRYDTSTQSNWFVDGSSEYPNLYIIASGDPRTILSQYQSSTYTSESVSIFGDRFASVVCIGTERAKGGRGFTGTAPSYFKSAAELFAITTPPVLQARGYLNYFDPRLGGNARPLVVSDKLKLYPNSSVEEVTEAWNRYNESNGINKALNQLRFNSTDGEGQMITSLDELIKLYPKYHSLTQQSMAQSLWEISGNTRSFGKKVYIDGKWWDAEPNYVGLWETYAKRGLSDDAIRRELLDGGYTQAQINIVRGIRNATPADILTTTDGRPGSSAGGSGGGAGGPGGGTGGGTGGATSAKGAQWTGPEGYRAGGIQNIAIQRSRNIFFTSEEIGGIATNGAMTAQGVAFDNSKPVMYQVYRDGTTNSALGQAIINQYVFDIVPNEINYSGFGGEWVNIDRVGTFPFIDWKSFKLLQISFSFVIAAKNGRVTADGLETPITDQIELLQRMAQTPFPVLFYGFDTLMTNQFRYDDKGNARGVQFVIQDLSIGASRRNTNMEITRATANITLQEIPIERQSLIGMPRLKHTATVPGEPVTITDPGYAQQSENSSSHFQIKTNIGYPAETSP